MTASLTNMHALTEEQKKFIYFLDVVGVSVVRATELSGLTIYAANKMLDDPDVAHYRKVQKDLARHKLGFTREDITEGIHDAVQQAKLLADPMAQIRGWTEIARINGLDAPKKVEVEVTHITDPNAPTEQIRQLSMPELAKLVDDGKVIDADFYVVRDDE